MEKKKESPKVSLNMDNFNSTANLTTNAGFQSNLSIDVVNEKDDLYNPFDHRDVEKPNSDLGSLIHLLKSSLGSGILAMPNAFSKGGIVVATAGTIIIGFICAYCVHILVTVSRELCKISKVPSLGFAETCGAAFQYGPKKLRSWANPVRIFVDWALVCTYIGANCVYVVLIASQFYEVIDYYYKDENWDLKIYCALLLVPLVILGQIRNLKYLVPFSGIANVLLLVALAITMYYIFQDIPPVSERDLFGSINNLPIFLSTVVFAMEGIGVVMPVENEMKNPQNFLGCPGVLNIAMSFVVGLYTIIGLFGYLKFGEGVAPSITSSLPPELIPSQIAKICIGLAILFTYGLQFYVPMDIIFKKIEPKLDVKYHNVVHIFLRTFFVAFTVAIGAAVPNLEALIGLVGAVFFSTLGVFIPAVVETIHLWNIDLGKWNWKLYKNILIATFSVFALVSGSYISIKDIVVGKEDPE